MTDPKQKTPPGDTARASDAPTTHTGEPVETTPIRNTVKSPFVIPGGPVLAPGRVTPVPSELWKTFAATDFAKALLEDGSIEEASDDDLASQAPDPNLAADEEDARAAAAKKAGKRK